MKVHAEPCGGKSRPALCRPDSRSGNPTPLLRARHCSLPARALTVCGSSRRCRFVAARKPEYLSASAEQYLASGDWADANDGRPSATGRLRPARDDLLPGDGQPGLPAGHQVHPTGGCGRLHRPLLKHRISADFPMRFLCRDKATPLDFLRAERLLWTRGDGHVRLIAGSRRSGSRERVHRLRAPVRSRLGRAVNRHDHVFAGAQIFHDVVDLLFDPAQIFLRRHHVHVNRSS